MTVQQFVALLMGFNPHYHVFIQPFKGEQTEEIDVVLRKDNSGIYYLSIEPK